MLGIFEQIDRGILVCPTTHARLRRDGDCLIADSAVYRLLGNVPVLITDTARIAGYLSERGGHMQQRYAETPRAPSRLEAVENRVYRSEANNREWAAVASRASGPDAVCVSIGGGPERNGEFLNLNIGPFPNVDIVADAYQLPYADGSVDAICCAAVLEHLEYPDRSVQEMARVMMCGGELWLETPFLQPYHAFPNHFQNFTLTGQERLAERHGFEVVSSGVGVGPCHVVYHIITAWMQLFCGAKLLNRLVSLALAILFKPIDRKLWNHPNAIVIASTTYVRARRR